MIATPAMPIAAIIHGLISTSPVETPVPVFPSSVPTDVTVTFEAELEALT
jgi:hypothetical protein